MSDFLVLEGGFLAIAAFFLIITTYVTTRPFMGKNAFKIGFPLVFIFLSIAIGAHYLNTKNRMNTVQQAFNDNKTIICESRVTRGVERTVLINKKKKWHLEDGIFTSENYSRGFHSARCLVHFNQDN